MHRHMPGPRPEPRGLAWAVADPSAQRSREGRPLTQEPAGSPDVAWVATRAAARWLRGSRTAGGAGLTLAVHPGPGWGGSAGPLSCGLLPCTGPFRKGGAQSQQGAGMGGRVCAWEGRRGDNKP